MEKETVTVLGDELKNLFKIILLGFISLDFFSPLTFKFFATFLKDPNQMKLAFIVFRAFYLSLPILFLVGYLLYTSRAQQIFRLAQNVKSGLFAMIILSIAALLLLITTYITLFDLNGTMGTNRIVLLINCVGFVVLAVGLIISIVQWRAEYQKEYLFVSCIIVVAIIIAAIVFNAFVRGDDSFKKEEYRTELCDMYTLPFREQSALQDHQKPLDSIKQINAAVLQKIQLIQLNSISYTTQPSIVSPTGLVKRKRSILTDKFDEIVLEKDNKSKTSPVMEQSIRFGQFLNNQLDDIYRKTKQSELKQEEYAGYLKDIEFGRSSLSYLLFSAETGYQNKQTVAMKAAISLLHYQQIIEVVILIGNLIILIFTWSLLSKIGVLKDKLLSLKAAIFIYLLMGIQMLKPIDPNHINLQDVAWPFTYANWYLPGYIQSIGEITNNNDYSQYDFSTHTGESEMMRQNLIRIEGQIKDAITTIDTIKKDTDSIKKKL